MRIRGYAVPWRTASVGTVACCILALPALAHAAYTVTGTSDTQPTPSCAGTVCPTLRAAVEAANANPGSAIQLGSATYTLTQGALPLTANVTITGTGHASTTIRQTAADRVIDAGTTGRFIDITGITITGGNLTGAPAIGGGILNYGTMTLTDVALTGNKVTGTPGTSGGAGVGGNGGSAVGSAVFTGDGLSHDNSLTLVSSFITNNVAQGGQGGFSSGSQAGRRQREWGGRRRRSLDARHPRLDGVRQPGARRRGRRRGGGRLQPLGPVAMV